MPAPAQKTVCCPCGQATVLQGQDAVEMLLRAACPACGRPLWESYFENLTGSSRPEIYALAHHVIDLAEQGAPLEDIALALRRYKDLLAGFEDADTAILMLMIPARISQQAVIDRFPLDMTDRSGHKAVAQSWQEEQDLRKAGFDPLDRQ